MYRVELKVARPRANFSFASLVPNVPCGVESVFSPTIPILYIYIVPNVPCGVESLETFPWWQYLGQVPNVPCGVESTTFDCSIGFKPVFLMYRVELKAYLIVEVCRV